MSNEVNIFILNKITESSRYTFSFTLPKKLIDASEKIEKTDFEKGINIQRKDSYSLSKTHLINTTIDYLQCNDMWTKWMNDWTSITLYRLYKGTESVDM